MDEQDADYIAALKELNWEFEAGYVDIPKLTRIFWGNIPPTVYSVQCGAGGAGGTDRVTATGIGGGGGSGSYEIVPNTGMTKYSIVQIVRKEFFARLKYSAYDIYEERFWNEQIAAFFGGCQGSEMHGFTLVTMRELCQLYNL